MKIFFILPIRGPINGVKVISSRLLAYFQKEYKTKLIDTAQAKNYDDFGKFNLNKVFSIFGILRQFKRISKEDIVYINLSTKGFSFYRDIILLKALTYRTKNIFAHIHANGLEHKLKPPFFSLLNKAHIIVINAYQKQKLEALDRVSLIENALPDFYDDKPFEKAFEPTVQILFISNLSKEKGAERLRTTCEWIQNQACRVKFIIAGGILDEYSQTVIDQIQSYNFVEYLGPIHDENKKMHLYQQSDLMLLLSDTNYEVSPLVYIEALMNGCAIITTEQVVSEKLTQRDFGFQWSEEHLVEAIISLSNPNTRSEISTSARQFYLKNYTFEDYYLQIKNLMLNE